MKHIYFIILLFIIASGSTNKAHAQFGLFDTVWTMSGLPQNYEVRVSPNDSLFLLWTHEKTQNAGVYIQRTRLFNTYSNNVIWDTTGIAFPAILSDNETVISWDSNRITLRNLLTLEPISTIIHQDIPIKGAKFVWQGVSEIDTSQYIAGYINYTDLKGVSKKFNYRTGQATITSDSLPYFAMSISEDGQYVAGVYYTGGDFVNVPINEVIEVRKINDYSLVFREEKYYSDYDPNIYPYNWVSHYEFKFSKDNKYLLLYISGTFRIYNLDNKMQIFTQKQDTFLSGRRIISFTKNSKDLLYLYYTSKDGSINKVEYILLNLENLKQKTFNFSTESEVLEGGDGGLLFDDKYILSETTRIYDKNYKNRKKFDMSLAKLNFDLNSIQEPYNPIQGTLYPNPTNNKINLTFDVKTSVQLNYSIYSETGYIIKLLLNEYTNPGTISKTFVVSDLPTGSYFLRITGERFSKTYKVIINR